MKNVKSLVVAIAMLAMPVVSMAAPSWSSKVNGSSADVVVAAPATLAVDNFLNSDGNTIGGYQHSLIVAGPAAGLATLKYGNPVVTPGGGFVAGDVLVSPAAGDAVPGPNNGEISIFKFSGEAAANNGATPMETINLVTAGLVPGVYTFTVGDSGAGHFLVNGANPNGISFGQAAGYMLTINPVPEPASALLLLGVVPFLRRRKMA